MEENLITHEKLLLQFKFEMNHDGNDGWTKEHYKMMYEKKLKEIEAIGHTVEPTENNK
jgi:hypothetical protein